MSAVVVNAVRRGFYLDSVALMRLSRVVADLDGVEQAALMMATPANKQILDEAGVLADEGRDAGPGDLVIAVRAAPDAAAAALAEAGRLLEQPSESGARAQVWRPRSIRAAVKARPAANLALISVPGDFAAAEARKALRRGLHVMIFSDNVSLPEEVELKTEARRLGLLLMGPDCGTAIINGVPLAFANAVPRGDVGIIGASGTGIQEVSCLIARHGGGISQAIGVGGRDLSEAVGAVTTLMALDLLDADPDTRHIVLLSKPPAPAVARDVLRRVGASAKGFTVCFLGQGDTALPPNAVPAPTLKAAARSALAHAPAAGGLAAASAARTVPARRPTVRGLFCGGTLCSEAQVVLRDAGERLASNVPVPGVQPWREGAPGHCLVDLGADEFTRGRPHPMIDPAVRDALLAEALGDADVGVVLLDVVLGYGAHPDPAAHIVRQLAQRRDNAPLVIASVTGTDADPQDRARQMDALARAGVLLAPSNADAAETALACVKLAV